MTVVIIIAVVAFVTSSSTASDSSSPFYCSYTFYDICYRHRSYVGTFGDCSGVKSVSGYCYYD